MKTLILPVLLLVFLSGCVSKAFKADVHEAATVAAEMSAACEPNDPNCCAAVELLAETLAAIEEKL
jgi:hypothetical protein